MFLAKRIILPCIGLDYQSFDMTAYALHGEKSVTIAFDKKVMFKNYSLPFFMPEEIQKGNSSFKYRIYRNKLNYQLYKEFSDQLAFCDNTGSMYLTNVDLELDFHSFSDLAGFICGCQPNRKSNLKIQDTTCKLGETFAMNHSTKYYTSMNTLEQNFNVVDYEGTVEEFIQQYKSNYQETKSKGTTSKKTGKKQAYSQVEKEHLDYTNGSRNCALSYIILDKKVKCSVHSHILGQGITPKNTKYMTTDNQNMLWLSSEIDELIDKHYLTFQLDNEEIKIYCSNNLKNDFKSFYDKIFNMDSIKIKMLHDYLINQSHVKYWSMRNNKLKMRCKNHKPIPLKDYQLVSHTILD